MGITDDLASGAGDVPTAQTTQKRSASKEPAGQPAAKKLTMKKSIADEIRRLNAEGNLSSPIKVGLVAGPLSAIGESLAREVLASLSSATLEEVGDPNEFICALAQQMDE